MNATATAQRQADLHNLLVRFGPMTAARLTKVRLEGWRPGPTTLADDKAALAALVAEGRATKTGARYAAA